MCCYGTHDTNARIALLACTVRYHVRLDSKFQFSVFGRWSYIHTIYMDVMVVGSFSYCSVKCQCHWALSTDYRPIADRKLTLGSTNIINNSTLSAFWPNDGRFRLCIRTWTSRLYHCGSTESNRCIMDTSNLCMQRKRQTDVFGRRWNIIRDNGIYWR